MWFGAVCVLLTRKCNANCDICCQGCSSSINEKVDVKKTIEVISKLKEKENINTVGITGGEPFLYFEDLIYIMKESKKLSMNITFTSNGFWGKNYNDAFEKLKILKDIGVEFFTLSVDSYHKQYVPYSSIRNIVLIAKEFDMKVIINSVSTKKGGRLKEVLAEIEDVLLGCTLLEIPCVPSGHAAERIDMDDLLYMDKMPEGICKLMNILTIMPNGDVYPCCSEAGQTKALYMGNIHKNTVEEILSNFYSNIICHDIAFKGPKYIMDEYLKEEKAGMRNRYVSMCDLCHELFKDIDSIKKIRKNMEYTCEL